MPSVIGRILGGGGGSVGAAPPPPTLTLQSVGNGQVTLILTQDVTALDSEIDYDDGVTVTTVPESASGTYTITGLTNGVLYTFTARSEKTGSTWSRPSVAVRAVPRQFGSTLMYPLILTNTETILNTLTMNGAGKYEVITARRKKPQAKPLLLYVHLGNMFTGKKPNTTGYTHRTYPVEIQFVYRKTDKITSGDQEVNIASYIEEAWNALNLIRPSEVPAPMDFFFLTEAIISSIDTDTSSTTLAKPHADNEIQGALRVEWEFWVPNR